MAEVPSEIASSAAQSGVQSREVAKGRAAARANISSAASRETKAVEEAGSTVDTEDEDNRIFTDAEGGGSQGRTFEEGAAAEQGQGEAVSDNGITQDEDGQLHLDLEA